MGSSYGATPLDVFADRDMVIAFAGPEGADVLFAGGDLMERTALHESSHAVAAWRFGRGISDVVVRQDGTGAATLAPMGVSTEQIEVLNSRGGNKESHAPKLKPMRSLSDGRRAVAIARILRADRSARRELLRVRRFEARLFVNRDAPLILAVAAELLAAGQLSGRQVEAIIERTVDAARQKRMRELGLL